MTAAALSKMLDPHAPSPPLAVALLDRLQRVLEVLVVALLAFMVAIVFLNVVLRFVFSTGVVQTEELSRYAFIWLIFLGAVIVLREGGHLGVDSLVVRLSPFWRKACRLASGALMVVCCVMFFIGSWHLTMSSVGKFAQASSFPMVVVFAVGLVASAAMAMVVCVELWLLATQRLDATQLSAPAHVD
jgi:TRAP-type C4-dicarboxylate transport system permease small subunit